MQQYNCTVQLRAQSLATSHDNKSGRIGFRRVTVAAARTAMAVAPARTAAAEGLVSSSSSSSRTCEQQQQQQQDLSATAAGIGSFASWFLWW
jgi:hypothetical protein